MTLVRGFGNVEILSSAQGKEFSLMVSKYQFIA